MTGKYFEEIVTDLKEPVLERRQTLPEYLRQLRISNKYRQNFVASKLNISRQTYSHYETGRIRPPAGALYSLAKLYEVPVENLISRMMFGQYGTENHREKQESLKYGNLKRNELNYEDSQYIDVNDNNSFKYDLGHEDMNQMERQLLLRFRSLNRKEQKEILSIIELKIKNIEVPNDRGKKQKV